MIELTEKKRLQLRMLIQFVSMAYKDKDIEEQFQDYKRELIKNPPAAKRTAERYKMKKSINTQPI